MKKIFFFLGLTVLLSSCGVFGGGKQTGCPSNGKAVGAEKLAAGDLKAGKAARKAPKFKY
jgi:hypothetical protein